MHKLLLSILFPLFVVQFLSAAPRYLPQGIEYDPAITSPAEFLGYEIGDRHLTHGELTAYLRQLALESDRIEIREHGRTHGNRPLLHLIISSPENLKRSDQIRERQRRFMDPERSPELDLNLMPVIVSLNYGIHGNEPSTSNSAPVIAYFLAAAEDDAVQQILDNVVILLDPSLNPDGFDRFAHWTNSNVGKNPNPDPNTREHREDWPTGRTNYYWFDLNRDWMMLTQPESRGRLEVYREWMPNFVLDFHEMETDRTYFFQPGVPERNHPLTPQSVYDLTDRISHYYARAFDAEGRLYYTRESFDDFYMGKASSMTDLNGSIGILFEQASSRGMVQDSVNGELTFPFTIQNQVTAALATLKAATELREVFHEHMRTFFRDSFREAQTLDFAGYRFTSPADPARALAFVDVLRQHEITVEKIAGEDAWFIPIRQPHYRYLQALIEQRREFEKNVFYDVTAWTLPLAYNLEWSEVKTAPRMTAASKTAPAPLPRSRLGYILDWRGMNAPRVLLDLLQEDVIAKVAREPFTLYGHSFDYGAIFIPIQLQEEKAEVIHRILSDSIASQGVSVLPVSTFLTEEGIDLGSPSFRQVEQPRIILLAGSGISSTEAGYIWHLLDVQHDYPVTIVSPERLPGMDLSRYTAMVVPPCATTTLEGLDVEKLRRWTNGGGTVVCVGASAKWAVEKNLVNISIIGAEEESDQKRENANGAGARRPSRRPTVERRPFALASDDAALQQIRGAIFQTSVDVSHPVAYGFTGETLPVFLSGEVFYAPSKNRYQTPLVYTKSPLLAGYASKENLEQMAGSAAVVVEPQGKGAVVILNLSPTFRAYFRGTEKLLLNAILFGPQMDAKDPRVK